MKLIDYNLASELKDLGFDEECFFVLIKNNLLVPKYAYNGNTYPLKNSCLYEENKSHICIPFYQQVVDWFEETHKLHIYAKPNKNKEGFLTWDAEVCALDFFNATYNQFIPLFLGSNEDKYKALEIGILHCIKHIKS